MLRRQKHGLSQSTTPFACTLSDSPQKRPRNVLRTCPQKPPRNCPLKWSGFTCPVFTCSVPRRPTVSRKTSPFPLWPWHIWGKLYLGGRFGPEKKYLGPPSKAFPNSLQTPSRPLGPSPPGNPAPPPPSWDFQ